MSAILLVAASDTKELPGWEAKPEGRSLPAGRYVSVLTMNFSQTVLILADGTFECRFTGEIHQKGKGARWAKSQFAGRWGVENGRIAFRYRDRCEERTDTFFIGLWESRAAFAFSRPDDRCCAFVADLFVFQSNEPNKALEPTSTLVTGPAGAGPAPSALVAHL